MKFTREHCIARLRIDCAYPLAIPRSLDHLYDGEGFGIVFDIEAEDGSVVPAGSFDVNDVGDEDQDKHKEKEKKEDKENEEQHDTDDASDNSQLKPMEIKDKTSEVSGKNETESKDKANDSSFNAADNNQGSKSVPAKKWYEMVEEEEEEAARSAPPRSLSATTACLPLSLPRQGSPISAATTFHHISLLRQGSPPISLPMQAAEPAIPPISLQQ